MRPRKQMCVYTSEVNTPKDRTCKSVSKERKLAFNKLKNMPQEFLQTHAFVYSCKRKEFDEIPLQQYDQYKLSGYDVVRFV
jgi:hypothetical protein